MRFSALETGDIEKLLLEQDLVQSDADAKFASTLSEGSLSTAKQLLEPELRELRKLLYSQLAQPAFSGLSLSKLLLEGLGKISTETPVQRINGQWLIRFTVEFFRAALLNLNSSATGSDQTIPEVIPFVNRVQNLPDPIGVLGQLIDRTVDASMHIDQNVTVPATLDALYDELSRLLRGSTQSK